MHAGSYSLPSSKSSANVNETIIFSKDVPKKFNQLLNLFVQYTELQTTYVEEKLAGNAKRIRKIQDQLTEIESFIDLIDNKKLRKLTHDANA